MAGGGVKRGFSFGESDDFAYNPAKDPVHVHDFQATVLHLLGIDHERLTYRVKAENIVLSARLWRDAPRRDSRRGASCHIAALPPYKFQGRDFRLTDVHGRVVNEILA